MKVIVRNMGAATGHGPPSAELELPEGATVTDALVKAGIPLDMPFAIFVNECLARRSDRLSPGDRMLVNVTLLSPQAGG